mmetsp:Transcript_31803/g.95205  ORF Transcript_31803/g.95205 Transcript_31803/m.95205 type:complete len:90 (+) Transcript_31803:359-628(+)
MRLGATTLFIYPPNTSIQFACEKGLSSASHSLTQCHSLLSKCVTNHHPFWVISSEHDFAPDPSSEPWFRQMMTMMHTLSSHRIYLTFSS